MTTAFHTLTARTANIGFFALQTSLGKKSLDLGFISIMTAIPIFGFVVGAIYLGTLTIPLH